MKKINVAQIGFGYWGKNILRNLLDMDNVEVVGICDANEANLEKATKLITKNSIYNPKLISTTDYNHIIENPEIDAVLIVTPPATHYELAIKALKAGKHVFIEKPMTTNYQEAIDIVNQGILSQKKVMVGHTFVYHPVINDLKKLIDSGELGDILYINFDMTNLGKFQLYGVLWDLAPHGISIVQHLLSNPEITRIEVNGISAIKKDLIDVAYLTLYFKNGSFVNMHFSWVNPHKDRKLTIIGSKKMAFFDDIEPLEKLRLFDKGVDNQSNKEFSSWGESIVGYRHGPITIPVTSTGEPLKKELEHFMDCVANNYKQPITDGSNGASVVQIIELTIQKLKRN
jgi:predicted dehydrogenase